MLGTSLSCERRFGPKCSLLTQRSISVFSSFFSNFILFILISYSALTTPMRLIYIESILFLLSSDSEKLFQPEVGRPEKKHFTPDMNRRRLINRAKIKSLRMSVVIVAAFLIWWTPYYVMMMIFMFWNPDNEVSIPITFEVN